MDFRSGGFERFGAYDSKQIGEAVRALTHALLYYRADPDRAPWVRELDRACFRACQYLVAHSVQPAEGLPHVLRHLRLTDTSPASVVEQW